MAEDYIKFKKHLAPSLTAGVYKISVTPEISSGSIPKNVFKQPNEDWIFVGGKRFRFDATDIDSVYPPANGHGEYATVIPHIVFHKSGLPWERETGITLEGTQIPWLALLVFDQDDPAPTIQTMTIGSLAKSSEVNGLWFPDSFAPEPDEDPQTTCQIIDISKKLFKEIAPSIDDLPFLAHAREVDTKQKADGNISKDPVLKTYSVVVANRLPRIGKESVVHLVSFEDYGDILGENGDSTDFHSVRLISLRNWRFSCKNNDGSFVGHFKKLNEGGLNTEAKLDTLNPALLHLPFKKPSGGSNKSVLALLQQGFIPMEHKFRQGLKSISWYRGPLIPLKLNEFIAPPFASADALLIYDSKLGCYDVSYASAWQLGQLLGLKNKSFAKHLYFWKQKKSIADRKYLERTALSDKLPVLPHSDEEGKEGAMLVPNFDSISNMANNLNEEKPQAEHKSDDTLQSQLEIHQGNPDIRKQAKEHVENLKVLQAEKEEKEKDVILQFVEDLRTLKPLPYNYLIADPDMLLPESLKLFHVDPNWIAALVDGAMSIGDLLPDDPSFKNILLGKKEINKKEQGYSGFLLRSSIINIWPGLEIWVKGNNSKGSDQLLDFVRHERLAEDLILSIVEGEITELEFRQPAEGLHFGVSEPKENSTDTVITYSKKNRASNDELHEDLTTFAKAKIKIEKIAKELKTSTSSQFAYVMVQTSAAVKININPQ